MHGFPGADHPAYDHKRARLVLVQLVRTSPGTHLPILKAHTRDPKFELKVQRRPGTWTQRGASILGQVGKWLVVAWGMAPCEAWVIGPHCWCPSLGLASGWGFLRSTTAFSAPVGLEEAGSAPLPVVPRAPLARLPGQRLQARPGRPPSTLPQLDQVLRGPVVEGGLQPDPHLWTTACL